MMLQSKFWAICFILILAGLISGQTPEVEWEIFLGDTLTNDYGMGAFQTSDGGYIVGGNCNYWNGGFYDNVIFKLDANGDTLWSAANRTNDYQENASSFRLMPDGSYMFSGYTDQNPDGGTAYLYNVNPDGSYGWTGLYGTDSIPETATCPAPAGDSAYVLVTNCWYSPEYGNDMRMYYVGLTGWESWTQPYHSEVADNAYCINALSTGEYIVTGYTQNPEYYDYELLMLRIGMWGGIQVWNAIGGSQDDAGNWVIETSDGGFLATGYTKERDGIGKDVFAVKTDADCIPQWQKIYGFSYHDQGVYCAESPNGGYVVGATCWSDSTGFDFWLLRLDTNGDTLWTKVVARDLSQSLFSMDLTDDGGFLLCGNSSSNSEDSDIYVVKLGPETGIADRNRQLPGKIALLENYPNPFNGSTVIRFTVPEKQEVTLKLYDALGREIKTILRKTLERGEHSVNFDGSTMNTGVYFYTIYMGSVSQTNKMVIIK